MTKDVLQESNPPPWLLEEEDPPVQYLTLSGKRGDQGGRKLKNTFNGPFLAGLRKKKKAGKSVTPNTFRGLSPHFGP